ncbi:MAG: reverse transcriptase, partial [Chloroflexota bacterium]|nr:reverse transcriptase [Chloroflexota bacterium]
MTFDDPKAMRALVPARLRLVADERAHHRARARYIVRADVNRCYPSIYTHSLAWAAHTKPVAKANPTSKSPYGNELDRHVRSGQGKQTVG